jgi:hypothetical protein
MDRFNGLPIEGKNNRYEKITLTTKQARSILQATQRLFSMKTALFVCIILLKNKPPKTPAAKQ